MSFDAILGQPTAVQTLTRALERGNVHHAYRFEGPDGVGKELTALHFARALLCGRTPLGCGECSACQRALAWSNEEPRVPIHPDLVLLARGLYRSVTGQSEAQGIGIDQIRRLVLSRVGFGPHEGRALVFIVREAELLTLGAANSLLKTLEEPPPRTTFVLLTSRPSRLLDTIRSRTQAIRFGPLPDRVVAEMLEARGLSVAMAPLAQGSMELALTLASEKTASAREAFIHGANAALEAPDLAPALAFAESRKGERAALQGELSFLAQDLATRARELIGVRPRDAVRLAARHHLVLCAIDELEKNGQPALVLESLFIRMRKAVA